MIQHIFKIIWKERKVNTWILFELIIVFCVLWFCSEYMFVVGKHYLEPKGYNLEHTYLIDFGKKNDDKALEDEDNINYSMAILDRIKKYPLIENVCFSGGNHPYSGNTNGVPNIIANDKDTLVNPGGTFMCYVSPEYFDVFSIGFQKGHTFDWASSVTNNEVIISPDGKNTLFGKPIKEIEKIKRTFVGTKYDYMADSERSNIVVGATEKIKFIEFEPYGNLLFYPIEKDRIHPFYNICVRVKAHADKDFAKQFKDDMESQLEVGPYFLVNVIPFSDIRARYLKDFSRFDKNFKSISAIGSFLLVNIFLGVIGTFWFRIQSRRSDIGLRMAMGASRKSVKNLFIKETLILLFLASIISSVICINVSLSDLLKVIGMPSVNREKYGLDSSQYIINYAVTFITLAIISTVAVWYPANRASKIQPAIVLKDE